MDVYFHHHLLRVFPSCDAAAWRHYLSVKTRLLSLPKYLSSVLVCPATSSLAASYLSLFHWFSAVWLDVPWCECLCVCPVYGFLGCSDLCISSFHQIRRLCGHDFFIIVSAGLPFLGHKPHVLEQSACSPGPWGAAQLWCTLCCSWESSHSATNFSLSLCQFCLKPLHFICYL